MELRHLRYFVAIAEEGSFTRASERLWVAQPALSSQVRRLEAELGIQLFERHARGIAVTPAGELFLERARVVLAAAEAARSTGQDLNAGLVGTIRLGIDAGLTWDGTALLLEAFGRERPEVELTVVESFAGTLLRDLHDGRLDAVLVPSAFGPAEPSYQRMGREPWLVLAGQDHRLAGDDRPVDAAELEGEAVVVTGHRDGVAYDRAVAEMLAAHGVTPVLARSGAGPALLTRVRRGKAVALATAPADGLVARRLDPVRWVDFALMWATETPAPALGEFIAFAATVAERTPPALRAVA